MRALLLVIATAALCAIYPKALLAIAIVLGVNALIAGGVEAVLR